MNSFSKKELFQALKIPKNWQKPDTDIKNPALWICHLPTNSLGIIYISLYSTELVIKKEEQENKNASIQTPEWVSSFLFELLNSHIDKEGIIFYPCVGEGSLLKTLFLNE
jgi:hypothetical protein